VSSLPLTPELRNAITDTYSQYGEGIDCKKWPQVRACFADQIRVHYDGMDEQVGGPGEQAIAADDWVAILRGTIDGFDTTQHMITNHRFKVEEGDVVCSAYLYADHTIFSDPQIAIADPQTMVTVVGEYVNRFRDCGGQWKIVASRLALWHMTGNVALFESAKARAAALRG
jgi:SnoaL-like domain